MADNATSDEGTHPIPKIKTAIKGLDEVLHGGLPANRTTLIKGAAGTGKTVLGLEFIYNQALKGEPSIMVCFEETAETIRQNAASLGWNFEKLENSGKLFIWEASVDRNSVTSGEFSILSFLAALKGKAEQMQASCIMIDAIDVLMSMFEDHVRERSELYKLHEWLKKHSFTTILTAKLNRNRLNNDDYEILDYMTDCVIFLDLRVADQVSTRRLRIIKYRGSGFGSNEFPYIITEQGSVIMPVTQAQLAHTPSGEKISSGNENLDIALGGGYTLGQSILVSGSTGTGKTTLAATFTRNICSQGHKVIYISFEESQEAIIATMQSPGIDLTPAVEKGKLLFHTIMPEAMVPEAHLYRIYKLIEDFSPQHIIIDAVSACKRMNNQRSAFDFLVRLINTCRHKNITCLMTNQLIAEDKQNVFTDIGFSSSIDTLILLKFVSMDYHVDRNLLVVKSRGARNSNRHHLYTITDAGIDIKLMQKYEKAGD